MSMRLISEATFQAMKAEVEDARINAEQAKGAIQQLEKQLREQFQCASAKEANALLIKLREDVNKLDKKLDEVIETYKSKWKTYADQCNK